MFCLTKLTQKWGDRYTPICGYWGAWWLQILQSLKFQWRATIIQNAMEKKTEFNVYPLLYWHSCGKTQFLVGKSTPHGHGQYCQYYVKLPSAINPVDECGEVVAAEMCIQAWCSLRTIYEQGKPDGNSGGGDIRWKPTPGVIKLGNHDWRAMLPWP